jgi:hypothetical protein
LAGCRKTGQVDLEAVERLVRGSMHRAGAEILGRLLSRASPEAGQTLCACGHSARYHDTRPKQWLTALGPVRLERSDYVCPPGHQGQSPRDRELDVEGTEYSPGVRRRMAVVGGEMSFEQGREQLELLAGVKVTTKAVERHSEAIGAGIASREHDEIRQARQLPFPEVCVPSVPVLYREMDGTGVPVAKSETEGRAGKVEGEAAHTREVKLGCVFTQTATDQQGRPVRDESATSYVAAIEPAEEFGLRLYTEAWRRGWSRAEKKVVIGDGAVWIWNLADPHFPGAIQIVDLYHARQHLWELGAKLFPNQAPTRQPWAAIGLDQLDQGKIEDLVKTLRDLCPANAELAKTVGSEADYFERNTERMRYLKFRAQGLFVGSGVVEAGCKTVIGARLKPSGMFGTVRGANAIMALRGCRLSGRFQDYWESRSRAA